MPRTFWTWSTKAAYRQRGRNRYEEIEPFYTRAEALYRVRGELGDDPTEPYHSTPYPYPAIPDEPALADVRERLSNIGMHPAALPLGVDLDAWLARAKTPWDCYPDTRTGKMDAETCALEKALKDPNVSLETEAEVRRLMAGADGRIVGIEYLQRGNGQAGGTKDRCGVHWRD